VGDEIKKFEKHCSRCLFAYCDGSITIMWSLNVFINDIPLPCRRV